MQLFQHPAFDVFAFCSAVLVFKMMIVGHIVGIGRIRLKAFINPEDAAALGSGEVEPVAAEHPDIDRGLRAHRNDLESTLPFLAIGWVYLAMGPSEGLATWLFVSFTALRCAFSVFYLRGMQPWRSLSFLAAELVVIIMLVQIVYRSVQ